ncbi:hypothetical protein [Methylobacterium sp. Leaf106]|uniref:hypothetical protein n=1 Tax=Methylobacterium sp. Leaf106 TaxID=1736255 RepID=UPI0006FBDE7F|nr:hypothetical protein [Methylobacterium sp. Leaf106]KQP52983.1 hypothetical protein ASF34_01010 [Methylobacterium sp. Leaf106]
MSEQYEKARAIAEGAANGWDKFSDTAGVARLADQINRAIGDAVANEVRQRDGWKALYEQTDPNAPSELCNCRIGDCTRVTVRCREFAR